MIQIKRMCFLLLALLCLARLQVCAQGQRSGIRGVIIDQATKQPVPGTTIYVIENQRGTQTSAKGSFELELPPGVYTIEARYIGYRNLVQKVSIGKGQFVNLDLKMAAAWKSLSGVTVEATRSVKTERALLAIRRKSAVIQDAIGAEQIEKTASITTAQALQKITGVSLKDGRYIAVRGLSDRNLVIQLNGARLSGADAGRSSVPMDLIPAALLENITVEKSVTPDKPGDATAAVVDIKTKSIPDSAFAQLVVQTGFNSNVGPYGYYNSFQGGNLGYVGQNAQRQNISAAYTNLIQEYTAKGYSVQNGTMRQGLVNAIRQGNLDGAHFKEAQRINAAAESFSPVLATQGQRSTPDQIMTFTYGNRFQLRNDRMIGIVAGINYYNRYLSNPNGNVNRYSVPGFGLNPNVIVPNENNLLPLYQQSENSGIHQISYGALATLAYRFNSGNEVSLTYNGNFGAETNSTYLSGRNNSNLRPGDPTATPPLQNSSSSYEYILRTTTRPINTFQARGEHRFRFTNNMEPWRLSWSASTTTAKQNDPNFRDTQLILDSLGRSSVNVNGKVVPSDYQYGFYVSSTRYYRALVEHNHNYKADLNMPVKLGKKILNLKTGFYYLDRVRDYHESSDTRKDSTLLTGQINYAGPGKNFTPSATGGQNPGNIVTANGNLALWNSRSRIGISENGNQGEGSQLAYGYIPVPVAGPNSYHAKVAITAFYGMADFQINKSFRFIGGMRVENTDFYSVPDTSGLGYITRRVGNKPQRVVTQEDFNRNFVTNYLTYTFLPSGSLIYNGMKDMTFRLAYSKTITRPELNEIVFSSQYDPIQRASITGNPFLKIGTFKSYDFRYDYFLRPNEIISASVFYKQIASQIERVYLIDTTQGVSRTGIQNAGITFRNNPAAGKVYGLEFEVRKGLDELFTFGKYISVGANLMLARSVTTVSPVEQYVATQIDRNVASQRSIVDQPNYVYNFNLGFDHARWGTQFNLIYNKTGRRLVEINVDGTPNIYEYPAGAFDVTFSQKITRKLQFKAFVKNLLNEKNYYLYNTPANTEVYGANQTRYVQRQFTTGAAYTFGFNYIF